MLPPAFVLDNLSMVLEEQRRRFQNARVLNLAQFRNTPLRGGFSIVEVRLTAQSL